MHKLDRGAGSSDAESSVQSASAVLAPNALHEHFREFDFSRAIASHPLKMKSLAVSK